LLSNNPEHFTSVLGVFFKVISVKIQLIITLRALFGWFEFYNVFFSFFVGYINISARP